MMRRHFAILIIVLAFAGLTLGGVYKRLHNQRQLEISARAAARQIVAVTHPQPARQAKDLVLPANVHAFRETPIYARVNGYLKRWHTDIGAQVREGQLLAEIDTPELDQELLQAEAAEGQAIANRDIAKKTDVRWQELLKSHFVSQQEADQNRAQLRAREADLRAAEANVKRLRETQAFKRVKAPFDGVVTARYVDVGTLISMGNGQQLFQIAQAHILRVYAYVPQTHSGWVFPGLDADLEIPEHPGRKFAGKVVHTAGAIDPATRTLYVEVQIPNPKGEVFPGAFGQVRFHLEAGAGTPMTVPANALIFRAQGTQVAVVDEQGRARLRDVKLGRDLGTALEVMEGLTDQDRIILSPPDSLNDGDAVETTDPTPRNGQ